MSLQSYKDISCPFLWVSSQFEVCLCLLGCLGDVPELTEY